MAVSTTSQAQTTRLGARRPMPVSRRVGSTARSRREELGTSRHRPPAGGRLRRSLGNRWRELRRAPEAGLATAEYAIATIAAAGFAGLLIVILKSSEVRGLLTGIIRSALSIG